MRSLLSGLRFAALACLHSTGYSDCDDKRLPMRQTKRAAMYVRMSTEHQQYSIVNHADAIEQYAAEHKLTIVRRFEDSGKSGLTLAGRPTLRQLLLEVISMKADFGHVLVYDVSRWGRFQDADESAYYEYTCKKANISLHYCVEQFLNDGSAYSALLKALKRTMAGEYSRELSVKVYAAQARFA
jgi:DNA invertase Pin-like site-specific DNA recombinase